MGKKRKLNGRKRVVADAMLISVWLGSFLAVLAAGILYKFVKPSYEHPFWPVVGTIAVFIAMEVLIVTGMFTIIFRILSSGKKALDDVANDRSE
jgi:hypothetical protein